MTSTHRSTPRPACAVCAQPAAIQHDEHSPQLCAPCYIAGAQPRPRRWLWLALTLLVLLVALLVWGWAGGLLALAAAGPLADRGYCSGCGAYSSSLRGGRCPGCRIGR